PDGRELVNFSDYKELDLDLLGPRSLFQYLCVAKSKEGKAKLARQLADPIQKDEKFTKCIQSFAETEEVLKLEASISLIGADAKDCDEQELLGLAKKKIHILPLGLFCCIASYILFAVLLIISLINHIQLYYLFLFIPLNFFIARKSIQSEVFAFPSTKYANLLSAYKKLSNDIKNTKIEDPYFVELQGVIEKEYSSLSRFSHLLDMLSYRQNIILSIIGNGLLYMDFIMAVIYNQFTKHLASFEACLDALSEVELMLSLAVIGMDNEVYSIPQKSDSFQIIEGYHPLVKNCIPNSFQFDGGVVLTGSNMSGKTTFMRMLGINQVLANAGGLVCAKEFHTSNYTVVTSLRANDMLQEGISTFYAEVNRMKTIMETSQNTNTLVLVDEIFKGTNAKDRIYSAKEIIKKLNGFGIHFLITTHDFEICDAEGIVNYHFDEEYIEDKISFDYKIKNGKCQKTNAIYLLKLAGVLDKNQ
ncbi:MAG: hypothetical protein K2N65_06160, partial [Anaeroplasmataceae bacterium]|nr:hypothetical protein [Anaeroplasmataceae bacterium]